LNKRLKKHGFKFTSLYKIKNSNQTTKCTSDGTVHFHIDKVTSDDVLNLWKNHESRCNILISKQHSIIKCKSDIGCNFITNHKIRFDKTNLKIFLRYNELNHHLIYEWKKYGNKSFSGLVNTFNDCPTYALCNRIAKI
jgi:hypothetical protein